MRRVIAPFLLASLASSALAPAARACVTPPSAPEVPQVTYLSECRLLFPDPVFVAGEPFGVEVTVSNLGVEGGGSFLMDQNLLIQATVSEQGCDGSGQGIMVSPSEGWVFLDDANAPHADQPSTGTFSFVALPPPAASAGDYLVSVHVQNGRDGESGFECDVSECITVIHPTEIAGKPTIEITTPVQDVAAGDEVPFGVTINRNGRPVTEVLTLRVFPTNSADPSDIFPIEPAGLSTTGMSLFGEEIHEATFTCRTHGPCYVGVSNEYHVTLHSGDELLCDTRWGRESGVARVVIGEAELAQWKVLEIQDESGNGRFAHCETGRVRLQAAIRNPWLGVTMTDAVLDIPIPAGTTLLEHDVYFHDNPMDGIDPTRAELETGAIVTETAESLRVEIGDIFPREVPGGLGPLFFQDLIDVELLLELPPEGPGPFFGLLGPTATAMAGGQLHEYTAEPLLLRDGSDTRPSEVSPAGSTAPLLYDPDSESWNWGWGDLSSESFAVQRGKIGELHAGSLGVCVASALDAPTWSDAEPVATSGWFYLISGEACGERGHAGLSSFDDERASASDCP